jgi:hypothetical protein
VFIDEANLVTADALCILAKKERRKELTIWRSTFLGEEQRINPLAALLLRVSFHFFENYRNKSSRKDPPRRAGAKLITLGGLPSIVRRKVLTFFKCF